MLLQVEQPKSSLFQHALADQWLPQQHWFCSSHSLAFLWFVLFSGFFPSFPLSSDISYLPTRLEDERRRFAVILGTEWGPAADLPIIQSEVSQKEKHQMSFF